MEDLTFSNILLIKPYVGPQWLVEVDGSPITGADVDAELADTEVEIVDTGVRGWGYDAIIAVTTAWGDTYCYLANR